LPDHLFQTACERDVLEYLSQRLSVAALRRCCKADQQPRRALLEDTKVLQNALIGFRDGVMRFVDDDQVERARIKALKARASDTAERRHRRNDNVTIVRCLPVALFDPDLEVRRTLSELFAGLV